MSKEKEKKEKNNNNKITNDKKSSVHMREKTKTKAVYSFLGDEVRTMSMI